jgi:hypothetical protein
VVIADCSMGSHFLRAIRAGWNFFQLPRESLDDDRVFGTSSFGPKGLEETFPLSHVLYAGDVGTCSTGNHIPEGLYHGGDLPPSPME